MYIIIAILFIVCGILLLLKARKISKKQGLHIVTGGAIVLIVLGVISAYGLLSGKIVLPLH